MNWLINHLLTPEYFLGFSLLCAGAYVFFRVTLQPLPAILCEICAIACFVTAAYAWADNRGYARAQTYYVAQIAAADEQRHREVTAQVLAWNAERETADKAQQERDREHELRIAEVNKLAARLPPSVANIVVPRAVVGVLNAAVRDTGTVARSAGKSTDRVSTAPVAGRGQRQ